MYGGCQKKTCVDVEGQPKCVAPTNIELDPDYVGVKCYKIYKKYYNYYGDFIYADTWVNSALEGNGTVFLLGGTVTNRLADFSNARPLPHPPSLPHPRRDYQVYNYIIIRST